MRVYQPREDSYLMLAAVNEFAKGNVLDIGTGSGLLAIAAARKGQVSSATAADISQSALKAAKRAASGLGIRFLQSDLFSKVPRLKYDTIIFNPPYLPQDKGVKDAAIYGGRKGHETIQRFLCASNDYLSASGSILLLFSTLTGKGNVEKAIADCCYEYDIVSSTPLFFERLYVYRIYKSSLLRQLESKGIKDVRLLAKGHRSVVFTGSRGRRKIAVKAARNDTAARGFIANEAKWLKRLNKMHIGPRLLWAKKDIIAYDYVDGIPILKYMETARKEAVLAVLRRILQQCLVMDALGVNKQEMHHPVKHILVDGTKPVMIDFERCKKARKPKNVTQFLQFIASTRMHSLLQDKGIMIAPDVAREAAREYRKKGKLPVFRWLPGPFSLEMPIS